MESQSRGSEKSSDKFSDKVCSTRRMASRSLYFKRTKFLTQRMQDTSSEIRYEMFYPGGSKGNDPYVGISTNATDAVPTAEMRVMIGNE